MYNDNDITEMLKSVLDANEKLQHANIIITGKTGVGKSTLINSIFRERLAETGIGKPCTQHIRMISKENFPIRIYDTKGLELSNNTQHEIKKEINQTISNCLQTKDEDQYIHAIWYCINTSSSRIEDEEIDWIRDLTNNINNLGVKVIIVLTQAINQKKVDALKSTIDNLNLDIVQIVSLLAEDYDIDFDDGIKTKKSYGCDVLAEITFDILPEAAQKAFSNAQSQSLKLKQKCAYKIVKCTTAAAVVEGAAPVPFSDCTLLIPTQVGMIVAITSAFGISIDKSILSSLITSILGSGGSTLIGKTIVSNVLKLIPGIGTIVGSGINSVIAGLLTSALGVTYIKIITKIASGEMKVQELMKIENIKKMKDLFKDELNKQYLTFR